MRLKGRYTVPELARSLRLPVRHVRRLLKRKRVPVDGPRGAQGVDLSSLVKHAPEIVESMRLLADPS